MYYGIDLHTEALQIGVMEAGANNEIKSFRCGLKSDFFYKMLQKFTKDDYVAVEASTNSFWFVNLIKGLVKECYVIDTNKFASICNTSKKTDKVDARKIVTRLKYFVEFNPSPDEFPTVYIPKQNVIELRSLFTSYMVIRKELVRIKNRMHSLFRQNGILDWKGKDFLALCIQERLLKAELPELLKTQINIFLNLLNETQKSLEKIKHQIFIKGQCFQKEIELLTSISGVSPFTAIGIMADVADISRFSNPKKFCSYLRAAPKVDSSGDTTKIGKISKTGRKISMCLLAEGICHTVKSNPRLMAFKQKKTGKSKGKIRVAVSRKTLTAIFYMLKGNKKYYWTDEKNHKLKMRKYLYELKRAA